MNHALRGAAVRARTLTVCLVACAGLSACGGGTTPPRTAARPLATPGPDELQGPAALAIDGHAVYIVDVAGQAIRRLDLDTRRLTTITPSTPLRNSLDIAVAPDHSLVVGEVNRAVRLDPVTGGVTVLATPAALQRARLGGGILSAVTTDAAGGIHLAGFDRVGRLEPDGTVSHVSLPLGTIGDLRADEDGTLFVSVSGPFAGQQRILRVGARGGPVTTVVGPGTPVRGADGTPQPRVVGPSNLAWDRASGLLFSDRTRILRLDRASGMVHVVSDRHPAEAVWAGLVVAPDDSLIVSDYFANRVRRIDARSARLEELAGRHSPRAGMTLPELPSIYPYPGDETCSNDPGDAVLEVRALGGRGTRVADAAVKLFAPDGAAARDAAGQEIKVMTDRTGVAHVRLAASGDYAFTVFRLGYLPASGAVRLSTSCTARIPVPLTLAPLP